MLTVPMIALKGFSRHGGGGVHRRGDVAGVPYRFTGEYLAKGLVAEDFRSIPGVELSHCLELGSDKCLTFEALKTFEPLPESCAEAIRSWRSGGGTGESPAGDDDFTDIADIGQPTADKLIAAGILTKAQLREATDEQLHATGISNRSFGAVVKWRGDGQV